MAAAQEHESLRERARRALLDNPEQEHSAVPPAAQPVAQASPAEADGPSDQIELRLRAIRLVRDQEPKRACYAERVRDLSRALMQLPGDSVHYRAVLEKLQEAHAEWLALEEKLWAANYTIRSTQWLVDLLADPTADMERGASAHD